MLAVQARDKRVVTIEGLGTEDRLHPVQKGIMKYNASQCGFCIPAMALAGKNLLDRNPSPSRDEIKKAISGVLCRCTGYYKLIDAIQEAAREMREVKR
jgi:carbon-monoxide dehydrogenase small subunit